MDNQILNNSDIYYSSNKYFRLVSWNNKTALFEEVVINDQGNIEVVAEHVISTEHGCIELDNI